MRILERELLIFNCYILTPNQAYDKINNTCIQKIIKNPMRNFRLALSHIKTLPGAFWIVIGATFLNQAGNMAFVFLILYLNQYLGFNLTHASFAFAVFSASMVISSLFGGQYIDRFGAARLMIICILINSLILFIFTFFHYFDSILLLSALWGVMMGFYRASSSTLVTHLSSTGMHKVTFSVFRLVINLGMSIGPAFGGYLAGYSYHAVFIANGIANLLAGLLLVVGLRRTKWLSYRSSIQQKVELNIRWLKRDLKFSYFLLSMVPVSMIFYQHESTLPVFLEDTLKFPLSFYGLLFTINTLIIVFFELPLNIATVNWTYRRNFMLGSLLITVGFAGLYISSMRWHVVLVTIIWTIGEMILFPACNSYVAEIAPEANRGSYMSLFNAFSNLGLLLGPLGGAFVMENFGPYNLWLVCGLWGAISIVLFNFIRTH
ncbi:MAG: hypothetical protein A3F12_03690 [Gammaproteobacteria bacterium RIFCSPHIGHO2_12_FULL_38_14]|nr:MAG: hypothetical protein A3F12_03690 [Gammaproteobacteria bacterium RIFCSPHIGHO2_12_FULL_38_14]